MWIWIKQKAADLFNESVDNTALCPVRLGGMAMLVVEAVKFLRAPVLTGDMLQAFGISAAAILAAMVAKQHVEH